MSIASVLAFVIAGVAHVKRTPGGGPAAGKLKEGAGPVRPGSALQTRYSELIFDNADLREANARLAAKVAELEDDIARANVQARRDQELLDLWRARALFAESPSAPPPGFGAPAPQVALQQAAAQMQLAQYASMQNGQQAQGLAGLAQQQPNVQNAHFGRALGLLGAQSLIDAELFCNCVPSRSQVWAADRSE